MRNFLLSSICLFLFFSCGSKQEPKTIYIVRHAEKMLDSDDPLLSIAGTARSKKLSQILADQDIRRIFTTNTIRTKATAQPLADINQLEIESYNAKNHDDLVVKLKSLEGNVLIVGHSNTVHHLVNYFVGEAEPYRELDEIEYDYIFIVELKGDGTASVYRKIYKEF